jgi:hypothetical protein
MTSVSYPTIEWNQGASRLKAARGIDGHQVGGGRRGEIGGFSYASRLRLMFLIASVLRDALLPMFITLTFPNEFPTAAVAKKYFNTLIKRLKRSYPLIGLIWKLEPQDRGAPHFHCLAWGVGLDQLQEFIPVAWFEIAGHGDRKHLKFHQGKYAPYRHCVEQVWSFRGVWSYASKYLGKTFEIEGWKKVGRYWGVINKQNIPIGKFKAAKLEPDQINDLLRYQRRFAHLAVHYRGQTIFCDADQWVSKLKISG